MTLGLVLGLFIGTTLGVIVMSLLVASDRADEDLDREFRRLHACGPKCEPLAGLHRSEWS